MDITAWLASQLRLLVLLALTIPPLNKLHVCRAKPASTVQTLGWLLALLAWRVIIVPVVIFTHSHVLQAHIARQLVSPPNLSVLIVQPQSTAMALASYNQQTSASPVLSALEQMLERHPTLLTIRQHQWVTAMWLLQANVQLEPIALQVKPHPVLARQLSMQWLNKTQLV